MYIDCDEWEMYDELDIPYFTWIQPMSWKTQVNLPIQINSLNFNPLSIWTRVIRDHDTNWTPGLKSRIYGTSTCVDIFRVCSTIYLEWIKYVVHLITQAYVLFNNFAVLPNLPQYYTYSLIHHSVCPKCLRSATSS